MKSRKPIVSGQFYPAHKNSCIEEIQQMLEQAKITRELPDYIDGGIVPHAGWTFSGRLAAMVFSAVKQKNQKVDTFIIFGAAHGYFGSSPAVYDSGHWLSPLGEAAVDDELAELIISTGQAVADTQAHSAEHSIEVQVPFVQHLFAGARIVPIVVPPTEQAVTLGSSIGQIISREYKTIVCIGSTDLTHYGPRYGFTPMGTGKEALDWAGKVNDKRFIDLALKLETQKMLTEAAENGNACGPGAAAATVAAVKELDKNEGILLEHTDSNSVITKRMGTPGSESVGYAAIVF
ncbi:MAG TPA: AmmeMemoRadiSam system protein B [Planctomycetes bacterium]|nr:AmmeMemoRadiSam system protein B [Planctomycetota bacterium]